MTARQKFTTAILTLILMGFPIFSWFNLQNGLNKRREIKAELKQLGQLKDDFVLVNQRGDSIRKRDFLGHTSIVSFLAAKSSDKSLERFKVLEQFSTVDSVSFWILGLNVADSAQVLKNKAEKYGFKYMHKFSFLSGTADNIARFTQHFAFASGQLTAESAYFALLDTACVVRNHYDGHQLEDMQRLVRHTAFIYPLKKVELPTRKIQSQK